MILLGVGIGPVGTTPVDAKFEFVPSSFLFVLNIFVCLYSPHWHHANLNLSYKILHNLFISVPL